MGGYTIAWVVIALSAVCGAAVLYWLLRDHSNPLFRNIIIAVALAFFVVPAQVPGYPAQLAPAFVVCIFEAFFQIDGSPAASLRVLLLSMAVAALLALATHYLLRRRGAATAQEGHAREPVRSGD